VGQQAVESGGWEGLPAQVEHRISVTFLATDLDQTFSFIQPSAEPVPFTARRAEPMASAFASSARAVDLRNRAA
jgi:hypothetical protein